MNKIYKIIAYIAVSICLSWIAYVNGSTFFESFNGLLIPLLATLLAINITTSSLVAGELRKIKKEFPQCDIGKSTKEIKRIFRIQIWLIASLLILFIGKDCSFIVNNIEKHYITVISNGCVIAVFCYFLEIIYDLGCSLFDIINFNSSK